MTDNFAVWYTHHRWGHTATVLWYPTKDTVNARSIKEANFKMRRRYARYGFQGMSLRAHPIGVDPNEGIK